MQDRVDAMLERFLGHRPGLVKLIRYSTASVAGAVTSQAVLVVCVLVLEMAARPANVLAVTAGAIPNYLINRAWTFNKRGAHSFTREVLPFWGMAILGLLLSTVAVGWAEDRWGTNVLALMAANIGSFGVLWVGRFFILDRILFAPLAEFVEHHDLIHHDDDAGDDTDANASAAPQTGTGDTAP